MARRDPAKVRLPESVAALRRRVPLHAWGAGDGPDRLAAVERDVRGLLADLAEARSALAEVADALDRVVANADERAEELGAPARAWAGNLGTVRRMLDSVLAQQGVAPVESAGRPFDPDWHTAVETAPAGDAGDGVVLAEVRRGYRWEDRVLRRAEVIVGSSDPSPAPPVPAPETGDPVP